jgi:hypothetical protein
MWSLDGARFRSPLLRFAPASRVGFAATLATIGVADARPRHVPFHLVERYLLVGCSSDETA